MTVALAVRARKRLVYDCGAAGMLNSSEIALRAGVKLAAINRRIHEGVRGEALLAPSRRGHDSWSARRANGTRDYREFCHSNGNSKLVFALQVVREFGATPPSVEQLVSRFAMSRATAYRWRAAWLDVYGAGEK